MDNRKTGRSNLQEFKETKVTVAAFVLAVSAISIASDYISPSDSSANANTPTTYLQLKK